MNSAQAPTVVNEVNITEEIIFRFKQGEIHLPSLPQISIKFKEMVDGGVNLQEVADLLKKDVAISFKLMSVANSKYYRGKSENKTLGQAITCLGFVTTKQYVTAMSNRSLYATANEEFPGLIEKLWEHSLSCAYASQILAETLELKLQDDAFTLGLMHDIGRLILLQILSELHIKGKLGKELNRMELFNDLDTHHGKFGAAILKRGQLPNECAQIASYHNNLQQADPISKSLLVVHFANLLVKSMGYHLGQQEEIDLEHTGSASILGLDAAMIAQIRAQVKDRMEELKGYLG